MTVVPWSCDQLRTDCIAIGTENFLANATRNPQDTPQSNSKRVRYAVVGLGYIAQAAVLPAFKHAQENSQLVALISDDETKRAKLARKYNVRKTYSYEQYADCLASGQIDAVYIALPNNMHRAYTEGAAEAGIHVLDNTDPEPGGKEGMADVRIIRALLESQDKNRPVRISPVGELMRRTRNRFAVRSHNV
jgi:Oxidoreductase family, NAD-binding Rossmann fold